MFSIGFFEIIVILLVGCLLIDPKRFPTIVKDIRVYYRKFIKLRNEVSDIIKDIKIEETDDAKKTVTTKHVIGDDGNFYEAYNVDDLVKKEKNSNNQSE